MKKKKRNYWSLFAVASVSLIASSCKSYKPVTVITQPVEETQPSWDQNTQNSGVISYEKGFGFKITETALKRYNSLVVKYGQIQSPTVSENFGITKINNDYYMSNEAMVNFILFTQKLRMGE